MGKSITRVFYSNLLLIVIVLQMLQVSSQGSIASLAVHEGDVFTYEVTEYEGLSDEIFYFGLDQNITLSAGEIFTMTILDPQLFCIEGIECYGGRFATVKIDADNGTTTTANDAYNPFILPYLLPTLIVLPDWEIWESLIVAITEEILASEDALSLEISSDWTDDYYQINITSIQQGVSYNASNTYDLHSGVVLNQFLQFQGTVDDRLLTIKYELNLIQSLTLDHSKLEADDQLSFIYEIVELRGISGDVFLGIDGDGLSLLEGDTLTVSVLDDEVIDDRFVMIRLTSGGDSIRSMNILDELSTIDGFNFLVYNDWEFFGRYWNNLEEFARDEVTLLLEEDDIYFNYSISLVLEDSFFFSEASYEKSTGILLFQSIIEDIYDPNGIDLKFTLKIANWDPIDSSKIGLSLGDLKYYKINKLVNPSNIIVFSSVGGVLNVNQEEIIEVFVTKIQTEKNVALAELDTVQDYLSLDNRLDYFYFDPSFIEDRRVPDKIFTSSFYLYTDWEYWGSSVERQISNQQSFENIQFTSDEHFFSYSYHASNQFVDVSYSVSYHVDTGSLSAMSFDYTIIDVSGNQLSLEFEIIEVDISVGEQYFSTAVPDISDLEETPNQSNNDESPGFTIQIFSVILLIGLFDQKRRFGKNK